MGAHGCGSFKSASQGPEQDGQELRGRGPQRDLRCHRPPWTVLMASILALSVIHSSGRLVCVCVCVCACVCMCVCVCVCVCARACAHAHLRVFGSLALQWQGPHGPKCGPENISLPYSLIHRQGRRAETTPRVPQNSIWYLSDP